MLRPAPEPVAQSSRVGGWLLLFCVLLTVWEPLGLALVVSRLVDSVAQRGVTFIAVLILRVAVTGLGVAAGLALWNVRATGVTLAKAALVLSAATSVLVAATSVAPTNVPPGARAPLLLATLAYDAAWYAYLVRSQRVRQTFE